MSDFALEVSGLMKRYGSYTAVNNISFAVPRGSIVGLLGPNGAGKTTTIQMLLGVTMVDAGTIRYFGDDFFAKEQEIKSRINYASSFSGLGGRITVYENLIFYSKLYNVPNHTDKIRELARKMELSDQLNSVFWDLSAGQKTRAILIKSLLNDPELLLLDEPTTSLDPDISDKLISLIESLRTERNMSILFTSHDMNEVNRLCDTVIFLDHGTILAHDTPDELVKRIPYANIELIVNDGMGKIESYLRTRKIKHTIKNKSKVTITCDEDKVPKIIFGISKVGSIITDIEIHKPTLDDFFLSIARNTPDEKKV